MSIRPSERTKFPLSKLVITSSLGGLAVFIFFFIPPMTIWAVLGFIGLISCLVYLIASFFLPRKYQLLATALVFLFFLVSYLVGFQILNTVLILSFIIGLALLIQ